MATSLVFPALKRKEFAEVMKQSYLCMGMLAIYHYNDFKNFLKIFFDQYEKRKSNNEFREFDMYALFVIFDTALKNDTSSLGSVIDLKTSFNIKLDEIIKRFLYFPEPLPRKIAFVGVCRLLIQNQLDRPEFYISRLIVIWQQCIRTGSEAIQEFSTHINEVMENFIYIYSTGSEPSFNNLISSILIILNSTLYSDLLLSGKSANTNSVAAEYSNIKFEKLNQLFIKIINYRVKLEKSEDKVKKQRRILQRKVLFRVLKKIVFMLTTLIDSDAFLSKGERSKGSKVSYASSQSVVSEHPVISLLHQKNLLKSIVQFYDGSLYEQTILGEFYGEDHLFSIKFFSILNYFEETFGLSNLSKQISDLYNQDLKKKGFIVEINSVKVNLLESLHGCQEYVSTKQKIYSQIAVDEHNFLFNLKKEEYSRGASILEDKEEEVEDDNDRSYSENKGVQQLDNQKFAEEPDLSLKVKQLKANSKKKEAVQKQPKIKIEAKNLSESSSDEEEVVKSGLEKLNINKKLKPEKRQRKK